MREKKDFYCDLENEISKIPYMLWGDRFSKLVEMEKGVLEEILNKCITDTKSELKRLVGTISEILEEINKRESLEKTKYLVLNVSTESLYEHFQERNCTIISEKLNEFYTSYSEKNKPVNKNTLGSGLREMCAGKIDKDKIEFATELTGSFIDIYDEQQSSYKDVIAAINSLAYKYKGKIFEGDGLLTNSKLCHKMFDNVNHDKVYIQMPDLTESVFYNLDRNTCDNKVCVQCSLVSDKMQIYDAFMFDAMSDMQGQVYSNAAREFYRPYFYDFVFEMDTELFERLKAFQRDIKDSQQYENVSDAGYVWAKISFDDKSGMEISGAVIESASPIEKEERKIYLIKDITEDEKEEIEALLKRLEVDEIKEDGDIQKELVSKISAELNQVNIYKIGNGNCIYCELRNKIGFFYDIGYGYKSISTGEYKAALAVIEKKDPEFVVLSHWDMDHIAASAVCDKSIFDKYWFAPNYSDACLTAKRLAKYISIRKNLLLVKRPSIDKVTSRKIAQVCRYNAEYNFYMGDNKGCADKSKPNSEGIAIEYKNNNDKTNLLMLGDVNYKSYNNARAKASEASFADTEYDYLIAPHHGSRHTNHELINAKGTKTIKRGKQAIICCNANKAIKKNKKVKFNRPSEAHNNELSLRFERVSCTEAAANDINIKIDL